MGELSPWHLLIVIAAFMLLFGAAKMPQAARSIGQSMRIFKAEMRASHDEHEPAAPQPAPQQLQGEVTTPQPDASRSAPTPDRPTTT